MGFGATCAEPALNTLGITVERLTKGTFKRSLLIGAVSFGVATGESLNETAAGHVLLHRFYLQVLPSAFYVSSSGGISCTFSFLDTHSHCY
eukprot:SAG31_NODE_1253_length_9089_cov_17.716765_8_plen_91_part_00